MKIKRTMASALAAAVAVPVLSIGAVTPAHAAGLSDNGQWQSGEVGYKLGCTIANVAFDAHVCGELYGGTTDPH